MKLSDKTLVNHFAPEHFNSLNECQSKVCTYLLEMYHHRLWEAFYKRNNVNAIKHPCIHSSSVLSLSIHYCASYLKCLNQLFVSSLTGPCDCVYICIYYTISPCTHRSTFVLSHTVSLRNLKDRLKMLRHISKTWSPSRKVTST